MYKIGIDIGGTKINIGIVDNNNVLVISKKIYLSEIENLTDTVISVIDELCISSGIIKSDIISCGIGIPGTVSEDGKRILKVPNIDILSENTAFEIENALSIPTILVQDSRAAAWGEYIAGAGVGAKSVVCITLGTGIGTGIVIDGEIFDGALGNAGEIGHVPVCENGRPCGCGKSGCLEKYCAGSGLDMTAKELLGTDKTAKNLFEEAINGNSKARVAIEEAIRLLGNGIVSIINLLSPECVLFSGGLSEQQELYLNPLIEYIKNNCYNAGKIPMLKKAALGENSPLLGAALIPAPQKREPVLSASVMCVDALNFGKALEEIRDAGIQYIHCDIMDNHFVPNLMLPMELLNQLHEYTDVPFDYHIMAENPRTVIEKLSVKENDYISVHYESTKHLQSAITAIKEKGAKAAVAINPATPIEMIKEVLSEIDMVLVMTVNPGFSGQKIVPSAFDKIRRMRKMLDDLGYNKIPIEVDGNCSFENVPKMYKNGAEIFVVGTSSVFQKGHSVEEGTKKLLKILNE